MSRKLTKRAVQFARVWGEMMRWPQEDWLELVELRNALTAARGTEPKTRAPRKPKGVKPEGGSA